MKVAIISDKKNENMVELQQGFEKEKIHAPFINIDRVSLLTQGRNTDLVAARLDFSKYDAVYLKVSRQFTQFIEPFIDTLVSKGIYCQFKPEAFYIIANKPFQYSVLHAKGVRTSETMIFPM